MTLADTYAEDAAQALRNCRDNLIKLIPARVSSETVAATAQAQATEAVAFALLAINETLKERGIDR